MSTAACLQENLRRLLDLQGEFPHQLLTDIPKKWEKHGDLVIISGRWFANEAWLSVDQQALWVTVAESLGAKRLARKDVITNDGHRTPCVQLLVGDNSWVCHRDNGIKYHYDVRKCMFSVGNISEKLRMAKLDCSDEIVVDMFCGIGYFTLPLLVHAGAKHLHACDWNENAIIALRKNLAANKVEDRCSVYFGDNNKVAPVGVAQRVIMGLIPSALGSIVPACRAINPQTGGVMHIHGNVEYHKNTTNEQLITRVVSCNRSSKQEWIKWAEHVSSIVMQTMEDLHNNEHKVVVDVEHIQRVKSYGPRVDHLVVDIKVCFDKKQLNS